MRTPTEELNRDDDAGPIFKMMEELAMDGVRSSLEALPIFAFDEVKPRVHFTASIEELRRGGDTPQAAWRAACDAWERRKEPKLVGDVKWITTEELREMVRSEQIVIPDDATAFEWRGEFYEIMKKPEPGTIYYLPKPGCGAESPVTHDQTDTVLRNMTGPITLNDLQFEKLQRDLDSVRPSLSDLREYQPRPFIPSPEPE